MNLVIIFFIVMVILSIMCTCESDEIFSRVGGKTEAPCGLSPDLNEACGSLDLALNQTSIGSRVLVCPGVFGPVREIAETVADVSIVGISNAECDVPESPSSSSVATILCPNDNILAERAITIRNNSVTRLENLLITGCNSTFVLGSNLTVVDVRFEVNYGFSGGALEVKQQSRLLLRRCTFIKNSALLHGGAISLESSFFGMESCVFESNSANGLASQVEGSLGGRGGAVFATTLLGGLVLPAYIANCTFISNDASLSGGAVSLSVIESFTNISDCHFINNSITPIPVCLGGECLIRGGAIYSSNAPLRLFHSEFVGNAIFTTEIDQNAQGGAVFSTLPNPAIAIEVENFLVHNCTFLRNKINSFSFDSFGGYGAALYTSTQGLTVLDSVFTENQVGSTESTLNLFPQYSSAGGAIFFSTSKKSSFVNNSQFIRNSVVGGSGGAIYLLQIGYLSITDSMFVSNTVWSSYTNRAQGGALMAVKDTFVEVSNSSFIGNTALPRSTTTNPLTYSGEGGAIYIQSSRTRILRETSFVNNVVTTGQFDAGAGGGAVFLEDAFDSEINHANFTKNGALGLAEISTYAAAGSGGALYLKFSSIKVVDSKFVLNYVTAGGVQYSFGGAVACFYQYVSAGEGGDIEFHNSTFLNNAAFGVLAVVGNSDFRAGQGGAMSIIGVTSRRVILFNISFIGNFADSTGSQLVYSIGGAIVLSQASKAAITLCKFLENSAVGGFGNDIAIPTNSEDAVDILIEASGFYSPSFNITQTFLNVKQNLVDALNEAGFISYFEVAGSPSVAQIAVDDALYVSFPSPKDHFSSVFGFFVTSGRVLVNNVNFISRYHIFLGNFLNFASKNELSKYVSNTTFEISGSIPDSQLRITAVSATVTVKLRNGSCLGRLNAINCTVVVDRDMCISGGSAITGSSFLATMSAKPTIEFQGVVFHGAYYNSRFEFLNKESYLSFSGVNALVSGSMVVAESHNITKDVIIALRDGSNFIIGPRGQLHLYSDTVFESSSISNISSIINMGVISVVNQPTDKTELVIIGSNMNQTYTGQLQVSLDNRYETEPIMFFDNEIYFGGILNATIAENTKLQLYAPQTPTSFSLLVYNNVEAPEDLNITVITDTGLAFKQDFRYNPSKKTYNLSLTISEISCENVNKYYFVDPVIYSEAAAASNYLCHICLLNSSCGFCSGGDGGGCVYGDQCVSGSMLRDNCCLGGCSGHGSCDADAYFSSFECVCDFFYTGEQCENLSLYSWLFVGFGVFFFFFLLVSLGYYYYYMKQPNRVLEDLLHQLSGDKTRKEVISATHLQRLQQEFILKDVFVKYEEIKIEDKIGEGSFGEVFKASFRGAQVALKKLRNPMFMQLTTSDIEEFRKEAYMMSRLRHPNIVLVMGISVVELETRRHVSVDIEDVSIDEESNGRKDSKAKKTLCILTEYLEQGSLADILYGPRRIPAEVWTYELVLICAIQAAKGMLYLHSQTPPICHRDLKSSNLVVDNHWVVKVTDFGMSRIVPESSIGESVSQGPERPSFFNQDLEMTSNLGTTAWCAPEIFTPSEKARYSLPVDVYSFGMVLWELWERKRPYEELPSRFDVIDAIKAGNRPVISDNCPTGLMSLIQRCWQYDPTRRPKFSYIVRYLKEELARVQRQRNAGVASAERNFFTDLLSPLSTPNKLQELSNGSNEKKISSPWRGKIFGGSKSAHLEEKLLSASNADSQSHDRTTSKSSAGAPIPVSWRDRYVMKFSGWRASTPDMGLPPSLTSPPSAALPPQQIVRGQVSLSPETEVASAASSQRSFHGSGRNSA